MAALPLKEEGLDAEMERVERADAQAEGGKEAVKEGKLGQGQGQEKGKGGGGGGEGGGKKKKKGKR